MTDEDDEFVRIEKESLWRKRQIEENLGQPVYFKPKKEWVGLTEQELSNLWDKHCIEWKALSKTLINPVVFGELVQAKLKEKNHV